MVEYADYLRHRAAAQKIVSKMPAEYPCQACTTGLCCKTPALWVSLGDAKVILEGLQSRQIANSTRQKTVRQANDSSFQYCTFYDQSKEKHCLIYNHRPITCMIYGFGATPIDEATSTRVVHTAALLGKDLGLSICDLQHAYMCGDCYSFMTTHSGRIPIETIINVASQRIYVDNLEFPWFKLGMKEFAMVILANERLSRATLKSDTFPKLRYGDLLRVHEKSQVPQTK